VTVSEYNRRHLSRLVDDEPQAAKIVRLYNGVDREQFRPEPTVARQSDLILAVGRLVEQKGVAHLVRACRRLRDQGCHCRCWFIGEGDERGAWSREIAALGLEGQVVLTGAQPQEQLLQTMREAALLVLPCVVSQTGDRDGLPTVLLEALAVGLPAISTTLV